MSLHLTLSLVYHLSLTWHSLLILFAVSMALPLRQEVNMCRALQPKSTFCLNGWHLCLCLLLGLFLTIPGLLTSSQAYVAIVLKLRSGQIWQLASVCHPFVTHKHPDAMCPPGRPLVSLVACFGRSCHSACMFSAVLFGARHWLGPHATYTCICFRLSAGETSWLNNFCGSLWTCRL